MPELSPAAKKAVEAQWPDPTTRRIALEWSRVYSSISGHVDHRYIPGYAFALLIRPRLNNEQLAEAYTDKNVYSKLFPETSMPEVVLRCIHGRYYDAGYDRVADAAARISAFDGKEIVVKPATESGGGAQVLIGRLSDGTVTAGNLVLPVEDVLRTYGQNFVVQTAIEQHGALSRLYAPAVNTIRALTVRLTGEPEVASTIVRFGNTGSRVDNQASGGVSAGVTAAGTLKALAVDKAGRQYERHPYSGEAFEGVHVPGLAATHDLVRALHAKLLHFDVISWDVAIASDASPMLIEFNLLGQEIAFHQMNNGPLFGEVTQDVLERAGVLG